MPLVGEGRNVHIEYTIPENIKKLITDEFLKEFRNQLYRIHEYYSLDLFADEGIPMNTSTAGWAAALGKACLNTNNEELFNYWRSLPWYDSDIFDGELADMMVDRHFILGDLSETIEKQLGIKPEDLRMCNDCGKLYSKEMVVEITDVDEDELLSKYRCLHCQDKIDSKELGKYSTTDYYRSVLKELEKYKKEHPVHIEE